MTLEVPLSHELLRFAAHGATVTIGKLLFSGFVNRIPLRADIDTTSQTNLASGLRHLGQIMLMITVGLHSSSQGHSC